MNNPKLNSVAILWTGYDYRVPHPDHTEASAYYTDDLEDARETAAHMWRGLACKFHVIKNTA